MKTRIIVTLVVSFSQLTGFDCWNRRPAFRYCQFIVGSGDAGNKARDVTASIAWRGRGVEKGRGARGGRSASSGKNETERPKTTPMLELIQRLGKLLRETEWGAYRLF